MTSHDHQSTTKRSARLVQQQCLDLQQAVELAATQQIISWSTAHAVTQRIETFLYAIEYGGSRAGWITEHAP